MTVQLPFLSSDSSISAQTNARSNRASDWNCLPAFYLRSSSSRRRSKNLCLVCTRRNKNFFPTTGLFCQPMQRPRQVWRILSGCTFLPSGAGEGANAVALLAIDFYVNSNKLFGRTNFYWTSLFLGLLAMSALDVTRTLFWVPDGGGQKCSWPDLPRAP